MRCGKVTYKTMQHNYYQLPLIIAALSVLDLINIIVVNGENIFHGANILPVLLLCMDTVFTIWFFLSCILLAVQYSPERKNAAFLLALPLYTSIGKCVFEIAYAAAVGGIVNGIIRGVGFLMFVGLMYLSAKIGKEDVKVRCSRKAQFEAYKKEVKMFREHVQDMIRRIKASKAQKRGSTA